MSGRVFRHGARVCASALRVVPRRSLSTISTKLETLAATKGQVEVLKYLGGANMNWTNADIAKYSHALSSGLSELGHKAGDKIATLLPANAAELHCAQFAAAEAGFVLVTLDPALNDPAQLAAILAENGCKTLIYSGDERQVAMIEQAVPEFTDFAAKRGLPFFSHTLPDLKFFVTVGLDIQPASSNFQHIMAYHGPPASKPKDDKALLCVDYTSGTKVAKSQADVIKDKAFPAFNALLEQTRATF